MRKLLPIIAIASFLAGILPIVAWLGGRHWFIDLFNHFQVQYAGFLAVCLLTLILAKQRKSAALTTILLVVPLARIAPWFIAPAEVTGGTGSLRFCSFNVLFSNERYTETLAWVRESSPDAIYFSEVNARWSEQLKELGKDYPYWINEGPDFAFFSKLPILSSSADRVSALGFPVVVVKLAAAGGPVTCIGGHPLPPTNPSWAHAMDEFMAEMGKRIESTPGRLVVAGDFNSTRWSYKSRPLAEAGLTEAAKGRSPGPTWNRRNPILGIPIDRMLYRSDGLGCRSFEIGPDLGSDHRPVTGEFVW